MRYVLGDEYAMHAVRFYTFSSFHDCILPVIVRQRHSAINAAVCRPFSNLIKLIDEYASCDSLKKMILKRLSS